MALNKSRGNMYPDVTHTFNTVKGKCPHGCAYCYMKRFGKQPDLHFDEKELKTDLGEGNFIFVGSSCDMWAGDIPVQWIHDTLGHCKKFDNKYMFQSKNPRRMYYLRSFMPPRIALGTTIETNRSYPEMGNAPRVLDRAWDLFKSETQDFITIEPIMDFDLKKLVSVINVVQPAWVNIGADSQGHNLPEPSWEKVQELIAELKQFTEVKEKRNLGRLK